MPYLTNDAREAVAGADVVYTDAWYSMGQEAEKARASPMRSPRHRVNERLMSYAASACDLPALPAGASGRGGHRRGARRTPVADLVQQAENRMHSARGLLVFLLQDIAARRGSAAGGDQQ